MTPEQYEHQTKPFDHQNAVFLKTADLTQWGLFWETGACKTKPTIDTAAYLYEKGEIDTLIVIAPNGVHVNWITDEIPIHMPERLRGKIEMAYWDSRRAKTKRHTWAISSVIRHNGLRILAISYDAMMTQNGLAAIAALMKDHDTMLVFDESHKVKTPGAKRTKRAIALGKRAKYRRILTGTPYANAPFDVFSQLRCLDADFWKPHGFSTFSAYRAHFGVFQQGYNGQQGREYKQCVGYQRLDQLKGIVETVSNYVSKDEALDIPGKLYQRRLFEMTPEQWRVYREIKEEAIAFLKSGDTVTAPLAITRLLRMQQVTCGFVPTDDGHGAFATFDKNPRLELLEEICDELDRPTIIWSKFRRDIDLIMSMLGKDAVRYDGKSTSEERILARQRFQGGDVKFFVGNPAAGGEGISLTAAYNMIYASNSYNLVHRLQSEDRPHRPGLDHPLLIMDLIALGTIDEQIVAALRQKMNIASELTGDKLREWI